MSRKNQCVVSTERTIRVIVESKRMSVCSSELLFEDNATMVFLSCPLL
jgi:hypothetical protein